jgi:hypothetical protein
MADIPVCSRCLAQPELSGKSSKRLNNPTFSMLLNSMNVGERGAATINTNRTNSTYFSVYRTYRSSVVQSQTRFDPSAPANQKIVFASYHRVVNNCRGNTKNEGSRTQKRRFLQTVIVPTRTCRMAQHNRNGSSSGTSTEDAGQYAIARNRTTFSQNRRQGLVSRRRHHLVPQPQEIHRIRRT